MPLSTKKGVINFFG